MTRRGIGGPVAALAATVFVVSVVALVILELNGRPTANLMTLVTPVVAALFVVDTINRRTAEQNQAISKIQEQTNGVLDQRIKDGVLAALNARDSDSAP